MQRIRRFLHILFCLAVLVLAGVPAAAQEDPLAEFYTLVNEARLAEGLTPYGWAPELAAAAQAHAEYSADRGVGSHTGEDGSTPAERIAAANYGAWGDGAIVAENIWTGQGTVEDAFEWLMDDREHRDILLSSRYREIGIAVASDSDGRNYYVLDFGVRPNVLPIFINDGAETTESPQVAIRLSNEEAVPQGQGTLYVGQAIEVRISDERDFDDQPWQPWEELVSWTLPEEPGEHTVYVQFRDGAGRTTTSVDSIYLLPGEGTPTPLPPTETATPETTETPSPEATPTAGATLEPPGTGAPTVFPSPFPSPSPTPAVVAEASPAPFATWTPILTPVEEPAMDGGSRLVGGLCILQVVAILLGLYAALRRRSV